MNSTSLVRVGKILAAHSGLELSTLGRKIANHGHFFTRLEEGKTITEARMGRAFQRLSDRWPPDLEWPPDIARPEPTPAEEAAA